MKQRMRRDALLEHLMEVGEADLDGLATLFDVSRMTIHRDLDVLDEAGLLRKVRGGATVEASSRFESDYRYRERAASADKAAIAARAGEMIEPGMSVMLDDGSTASAIVPYLAARAPLTLITGNLPALKSLSHVAGITLICVGGTFSPRFNAFFGPGAVDAIRRLRADMALLSSSAVNGGTAFHQEEGIAATKRAMLSSASRSYLLADPTKFGRTALHVMAELAEFDGLVTTRTPPDATCAALDRAGRDLILVPSAEDGASDRKERVE